MTQVPTILTIDAASNDTNVIIRSVLPQGFDQPDLIAAALRDVASFADKLHGKHAQINGPCTTGMALALGHKLAHITKSVSIYDPKLARNEKPAKTLQLRASRHSLGDKNAY